MTRIVARDDFSGLVVAMASWCPSCRKELPLLAELYRRHQKEGIAIVAVSVDADGPAAVQPLINTLDIPFPVYWAGPAAAGYYRLIGIPTLMVYDHGRLKEKIPGSQPLETMEAKIKDLLPG
jgi:thiol-disulfide isomerase/thioredoxin